MRTMRSRMLVGLFLGLVSSGGCSDPPAPLTGQAAWRVGCPPSMTGANCSEATHVVQGTKGSSTVDVYCSVTSNGGGSYNISFLIAAVTAGQNFAESDEGVYAVGTLPAVGQELVRSTDLGSIQFRGLGYSVPDSNGTIGPGGRCHVFVDRVSGQSFQGRLACTDVQDDQVPPRNRYVKGIVPQTMSNDWAEFRFDNCDNR